MDRAGRGLVRELGDGRHDPAPGRRPGIVAGERQLVSSSGAFVERLFAVALDLAGSEKPVKNVETSNVGYLIEGRRSGFSSAVWDLCPNGTPRPVSTDRAKPWQNLSG